MKTTSIIIGLSIALLSLNSCKKEECHACHYEKISNGVETEIELGEKCGSELEELEKNGFKDSDETTYEVHCHEH
jgi:hypothetical protein